MKRAGIFAMLGFAIGIAVYTLHPHWLEEASQLPELLRKVTSSDMARACDPAAAFEEAYEQLMTYAEFQLRSGTTGRPEQSGEIGRYLQQLQEHRNRISPTDTSNDRRLLHAFFAAARICPADYRVPFEDVVRAQVTGADEEVAAEAQVLEFLIKHPLQSAVSQDVIDDLRQFARTYPRSAWGISLFSAASSQLWLAKQTQSAEQVLTLGLELYAQHSGRSDLARQLVDQGHRPPPASQISAADWQLMERAIESRRGSTCPPLG